jgi:hypothetical protein
MEKTAGQRLRITRLRTINRTREGFMFSQGNYVRDYIFPIITAQMVDSEQNVKRMLGTGFLIGNQGFALTAKHVIVGFVAEHW